MTKINKNMDEDKAVSQLIVGTENREIHFFDQTGGKIKKTMSVPAIPVFLEAVGLYDVDYRLYVACRDGKVYTIKNGTMDPMVIDIESKPVGLVRIDK